MLPNLSPLLPKTEPELTKLPRPTFEREESRKRSSLERSWSREDCNRPYLSRSTFRPLISNLCIFSTATLTLSESSNSTIPHPRGLSFSSVNNSTWATFPTSVRNKSLRSCQRKS
ncbi:GSCOCG00009085001-RA-CDS [Cotesia congregata]|nr:GSCOCG00009085001-RA-CDS [Cotesia congregata]